MFTSCDCVCQDGMPIDPVQLMSLNFLMMALNQRIFSPRLEKPILFLPLIFLALVAIDIMVSGQARVPHMRLAKFVTSSFLLNNIHVYFTLVFLLVVPEFRLWQEPGLKAKGRSVFAKALLVFLGVMGINIYLDWFQVPKPVLGAIIVVLLYPALYHGIQQVKGLSLLYNRNAIGNLNDEQRVRARQSEYFERKMYWAFIGFYLVFSLLQDHNIAAFFIDKTVFRAIRSMAMVLYIGFVLSIVINAAVDIPRFGANKFVFSTRLLLFATVPFSTWAGVGLAAIHGIEYFGVYDLVARNSRMRDNERTRFWLLTAVFGLVGLLILFPRRLDGLTFLFWNSFDEIPGWLKFVAAVSLGLTYVHYYLDAVIFRMRDREVSTQVAPLLVKSLHQKSANTTSHAVLSEPHTQRQSQSPGREREHGMHL